MKLYVKYGMLNLTKDVFDSILLEITLYTCSTCKNYFSNINDERFHYHLISVKCPTLQNVMLLGGVN